MMAPLKLKFVDVQRDRHGRAVFCYFRRNGRRWRLPGEPGSPEFLAEYSRLKAATEPAQSPTHQGRITGSFGALVDQFFADREAFGQKRPSTQQMYRQILEPLAQVHGQKPVALLERRHIKQWRDARSETPGTANMIVKVVRLLMSYAIENDYRKDNPALRIKLFTLGEHRAWTDAECTTFEAKWPAGSMQRRAYMLAKFTGQRCGDIARMTRGHIKDGAIRVMQQKTTAGKTNEEIWIPLHRDLAAELALGGGHMSFLTRPDGSAFDNVSLSAYFADALDQTDLPDECVLHGLRKTAARMLAEAGCSAHQIASITGHKSLAQVQDYARAANQKTLATAAIHQLEQNGNRTEGAKRPRRLAAKQKPMS
jgi:integrase